MDVDPFQGVKVEIICQERSLPFYDDPDMTDDSGAATDGKHIKSQYIEAVEGGVFYVKITFDRNFILPVTGFKNEYVKISVYF